MSAVPSPSPAAPVADQSVLPDGLAQSRKSYRRKYRKIMVTFEQRVQESNGLFKDEQRIFDISQRLAEQTDQLLGLLLELNRRPQIPKRLRYDLNPASSITTYPDPTKHQDEHLVHESLRVARDHVQKGEMTPYEQEQNQEDLLNSSNFAPKMSYASLLRASKLRALPNETDDAAPAGGILTAKQEEQYTQSLDDFLEGKNANSRAHAAKSLGSRHAEKTTDREREIQLKNPVSAYNWLRKHQPQVFLQDHETSGDRGKSASRSSKRTAPSKDIKREPDYYDEDGIALDHTGSMRGKRKREDDTAFRPKGGRSGHPLKRRKEENGGKRSKRSSVDARNA